MLFDEGKDRLGEVVRGAGLQIEMAEHLRAEVAEVGGAVGSGLVREFVQERFVEFGAQKEREKLLAATLVQFGNGDGTAEISRAKYLAVDRPELALGDDPNNDTATRREHMATHFLEKVR